MHTKIMSTQKWNCTTPFPCIFYLLLMGICTTMIKKNCPKERRISFVHLGVIIIYVCDPWEASLLLTTLLWIRFKNQNCSRDQTGLDFKFKQCLVKNVGIFSYANNASAHAKWILFCHGMKDAENILRIKQTCLNIF